MDYVVEIQEQTSINSVCNDTDPLTKDDYVFGGYYLICMSIICVVCFVGNGLIIHAILCYKDLRHVTNIFVLSLAISDFLQGVTVPVYTMGHPSKFTILEGLSKFYSYNSHFGI